MSITSFIRKLLPSTVTVSAWWSRRSRTAEVNRADDTATGFIAIDPEGAKDRDDAVWAKRLDAGRWHVKVAVADVGAYVQAGSPLDAAVRERAQSIYLVNECIHMCSEMLSSEICSLHEGRRKRALVAPHSSPWFAQAVKSVVERSPVRACVTPSAIESPPYETDGGDTGQR